MKTVEELQGSIALTNVLSVVWLGDWKRYEEIFAAMPQDIQNEFPFHKHYKRDEAELWHDNHFKIPGKFFISPYYSSYSTGESGSVEERRKGLLCLVGTYEKLGFYFPLENDLYPDHLGCIMVFLNSVLQEQAKAMQEEDNELYFQLDDLKKEVLKEYILPILRPLQKNAVNHEAHPFINEFIQYFCTIFSKEQEGMLL